MATVAIIQARMGSSRLPGKVLRPFVGKSALAHCVERTRRCTAIDEVTVATTTAPGDDVLVDTCRAHGWQVARGPEDDVLGRYFPIAVAAGATEVVRITSDCPLIDPAVVGELIARFRDAGADYGSTSLPRPTFPIGISAEVMTMAALECAFREDTNPAWREHVTPYLYRHPERFRLVGHGCDADHSHHRWTLDTPEDAALIERLFAELGDTPFTWRDALAVAEAHPAWAHLNAHVVQKTVT